MYSYNCVCIFGHDYPYCNKDTDHDLVHILTHKLSAQMYITAICIYTFTLTVSINNEYKLLVIYNTELSHVSL